MTSICLYFQVHQPYRLRWFWPDDSIHWKGRLEDLYFDSGLNEYTFHKVAGRCYHPTNDLLLQHIDHFNGERRGFKASFSLSGTFLDQCEAWDPDLLEKFRQMAASGCVEFLAETHNHGLTSLYHDKRYFPEEIQYHVQAMKDLLGVKPTIFRNTELLFNDDIAWQAEQLGFKGILTEGIERLLEGWKSPNYVYKRRAGDIRVLLRNYPLSDDVGYRFSARWWDEWPLTADKYASWLASSPGDTINVFMDYETFGEHQWEDTGIFWFLGALPYKVLDHPHLEFSTPSEVIGRCEPVGEITLPWYDTVSWADLERDPSAWLGNHTQKLCFSQLQHARWLVEQANDDGFRRILGRLESGDHFYYMCTKGWGDGDVHTYFSHHGTPYDAGINYLSVLADFQERILRFMLENGRQLKTPGKPATGKRKTTPKKAASKKKK